MSAELNQKQLAIYKIILSELKPKPKINGLEFAKVEGYLSPEGSAVTGRFVPFAYQEEPLIALTDDEIELIVFLKSTRIGYTKMINFKVAYNIAENPATTLIFHPNDKKATDWSKDEFKPLVRDMKCVGNKIIQDRESNTLNKKSFIGGYISSRGGVSANNYASATAKDVIFDEFSRFPHDVDGEGDPYELGKKRTESYWNGQVVIGSTPTVKGKDLTEIRFNETDQRFRYWKCPHCNHEQTLDFFKHIRWDKEYREGVKVHLTNTAYMLCEKCEARIPHKEKKKMDKIGRWYQTAPFFCCGEWQKPTDNKNWYYNKEDIADTRNGEALCNKCGQTAEYNRNGRKKRGYYIWAGLSYQPTTTWATIAETFVQSIGNPRKMKTFYNTWLGQSFEEENIKLDTNTLMETAEEYIYVPDEAKVILMTVDTQDDRLEYLISAWCEGETSYNIKSGKVMGDPINKFVWDELLQIKNTALKTQSGNDVYIFRGFIDMAGHKTEFVKKFVRANPQDFIMLKGDDKEVKTNDARPLAQLKVSQTEKDKIMWVATTKAKDTIFERLAKQPHEHGFIHHNKSFNLEWFDQLTSEKKVFKLNKRGFLEGTYVKTRDRNEALDLVGYQLAAVRLVQNETGLNLQIQED